MYLRQKKQEESEKVWIVHTNPKDIKNITRLEIIIIKLWTIPQNISDQQLKDWNLSREEWDEATKRDLLAKKVQECENLNELSSIRLNNEDVNKNLKDMKKR
ncbi:hypothetical protein RhiirA1_448609 [Rhizophagus irregularis]|uniref:Uncharacterized protein n=1 Tax=Rhizophagus irregularis TaxID=588596 RepID=A0A2N0SJ20_9GLOM|nr:hypothetical protein RhiirA1_448609 [Rhizophagus irregularis]CAB4484994.1 unnamed protein product [Rhizophagus irregularis]CAB5196132.1 unnamed protein product [Rhizophagus irregularis]CAB5385269.1 unnamed protein product [Rhizophagus irregularis]